MEEVAKTGAPEWMCPKPFPTYATSSETAPVCKLVVIGAGTGGLYSALRLIDSGKMQGADICVFELAERVGGRLYSLRCVRSLTHIPPHIRTRAHPLEPFTRLSPVFLHAHRGHARAHARAVLL
jgi:cation diffusion facilitator CzcD-associated flavoprotein CzcO